MKNGITKFARRFYAACEESVTTDFSIFVFQLGAECVPNRFTLYDTLRARHQSTSGSIRIEKPDLKHGKNGRTLVSHSRFAVIALVFGLMHVNASSPKPLPAS